MSYYNKYKQKLYVLKIEVLFVIYTILWDKKSALKILYVTAKKDCTIFVIEGK